MPQIHLAVAVIRSSRLSAGAVGRVIIRQRITRVLTPSLRSALEHFLCATVGGLKTRSPTRAVVLIPDGTRTNDQP